MLFRFKIDATFNCISFILKEYYQSDRPSSYPAPYRHSQNDLTEWEEHHNQHQQNPYGSTAALNHTARRSAGPERDIHDRYAYRNGNARENGDWEEQERPRPR